MATRSAGTPEGDVLDLDDLRRLAAADPLMAWWMGVEYRPMAAATATHTVVIPGWRPALLNELMGSRWRAHKLKKRDRKWVADYFVLLHRVPRATGRRRVRLRIAGRYRGGRFPDPDAPWKSLLDALVTCGMLLDDSAEHCELARPEFATRREGFETTIILEDLP